MPVRTSSKIKRKKIICLFWLVWQIFIFFTDDSWFQIDEDCPWDMFSCPCLREEGVEGVISTADGLVRGHLSIGLYSVFEAVELPTGVAHLATGLADMDGNALTLEREEENGGES